MRPDQEREYVEYVSGRLARLHRTAYLLCGDAHRAEDIVQVTLTALYVRDELLTALRALPKGQRAVVVLRYRNCGNGWAPSTCRRSASRSAP